MNITIPKLSLVVLVGPSGAGKSTFARKHFLPTEILSSDYFRGLLSDDENNQTITSKAFEALHYIAAKRLELGRLTVIDATNVQMEARKPLLKLARDYHCLPVAIVFNISESICQERNTLRPDRSFGPHVVRNHYSQMRRSLKSLEKEGFRQVHLLNSVEAVESVQLSRVPLWNDRNEDHGPFDFIGDLHGCADELEQLLEKLGYRCNPIESPDPIWGSSVYNHPENRRVVFVGDLVDRGPRILDTLRIVRNMVHAGTALCVPGNHDIKLLKKLNGRNVQISHGLAETLAEIDNLPTELKERLIPATRQFIESLISHYVLDDGKIVVAHAGMKASLQGRASRVVRDFALYGETTGEMDELGLPIRLNWAAEYRGDAMVVYGHTPIPEPEWLNRTINIDTGCVFGGKLTALRYPELELVSIPAKQIYCQPAKPFLPQSTEQLSAQHEHDSLLHAGDVLGKRMIQTAYRGTIIIREDRSTAALEVMSRYAIDPRWLIYLAPTMSACETSSLAGYLEHPLEAFFYFLGNGVPEVICEEKHMGSRAVIIITRNAEIARSRFGDDSGRIGAIYTRTGRAFFTDEPLEAKILHRVREAFDRSEMWERLQTNWACIDCEIMPWSAKAVELLRNQYAAVGAAGSAAFPNILSRIQSGMDRYSETERNRLKEIESIYQSRFDNLQKFIASYRRYCWSVQTIDDYKIAPFHLLATEGVVHHQKSHDWHLDQINHWIDQSNDPIWFRTRTMKVDLNQSTQIDSAVAWWQSLIQTGGEGMVIKPGTFICRGPKGLIQPALKCRGPEYLRIIYGPDYLEKDNLNRLRIRSVGLKRKLALNEFALGMEALDRFVRREPLRRVHECVFGILAMESEPIDSRL